MRKPVSTTRGGTRDVLLKAVKHFRLGERVKEKAAKTVAGMAVPPIMKEIEKKKIPEPGLFKVNQDGKFEGVAEGLNSTKEKPYLVLIHGTFSTTKGSFGHLFKSQEDWQRLYKAYDGRVVALEHYTVTDDPANNALKIAESFQGDSTIDLLSYSRGGLVGDLICRLPLAEDETVINPIQQFFSEPQYEQVRNNLEELDKKLKSNRLSVRRFVRVAAPVAGTILASERLDTYLNVILTLLGKIPIPGAGLFDFVHPIASAIISTRTKADQLPGIESMMPHERRGFVPFLNCTQPRGEDLAVIAGDVRDGDLLDRIKDFFSTLYYREANDFVVDSRSMFRGVPREKARAFYFRAPKADHFSYFSQEETRTRMVDWLADGDERGFSPIDASAPYGGLRSTESRGIPKEQGVEAALSGDKPIVFLLPGIMGTHLAKKDKRTWIDLPRLAWGGLAIWRSMRRI